MSDLGERLKRHRMQRGLSVRQLAKMAGVSVSYIYAIEAGDRGANLNKLTQISKALEVPLSALWQESP